MPHTTKYKRGDIVLVDFGFSEGTGAKKRPALIISSDNYHKGRQEVGLIYPSLVTGNYTNNKRQHDNSQVRNSTAARLPKGTKESWEGNGILKCESQVVFFRLENTV